jgi:hypothetical protein
MGFESGFGGLNVSLGSCFSSSGLSFKILNLIGSSSFGVGSFNSTLLGLFSSLLVSSSLLLDSILLILNSLSLSLSLDNTCSSSGLSSLGSLNISLRFGEHNSFIGHFLLMLSRVCCFFLESCFFSNSLKSCFFSFLVLKRQFLSGNFGNLGISSGLLGGY